MRRDGLTFVEAMAEVAGKPCTRRLDREMEGRLVQEAATCRLLGDAARAHRLLRECWGWNNYVGAALTRQLGAEEVDARWRLKEEYSIFEKLTEDELSFVSGFLEKAGWIEVAEALAKMYQRAA